MSAQRVIKKTCVLIIFFAFYACSKQQIPTLPFDSIASSSQSNDPQKLAEHYFKQQQTWTRHSEVFDHFEGRLFTSATLMSPAFEQARTDHHQKKLGLSTVEKKQLFQKRLKQSENGYLFFVTLSSSDMPKLQRPNVQEKVNEVIKGREDEIKASLIIDGSPFPLSKVDQLTFKRAQALHDDFPYVTPVKTGYWLYFEVSEAFKAKALRQTSSANSLHLFQLRFSSLSATALLEWNLSFQ